jgi:hypothetical protein
LTIEDAAMDDAMQVGPAVTGGVAALGWAATSPLVRDVLPAAARRVNVVQVVPPVPAWGGPLLAGALAARADRGDRILILAAPAMVAELGAQLAALAPADTRIEAARGPARAARRLKADALDVLVASPDVALSLHARSALAPERFGAIVFAWPEAWHADEAVTVLLQDLDKDAQRLVLTAAPTSVDTLVERYARRAMIVPAMVPALPEAGTPEPVLHDVRTLDTPWHARAAALAELLEATDPGAVTVWTVDTRNHTIIAAALGGAEGFAIVAGHIPAQAAAIVCHDLPDEATLAALRALAPVTLLVAPGTESYAARVAPGAHPVRAASAVSALLAHDAALRAEITALLGGDVQDDAAALYALAPLFERYPAQRVAAACFRLWRAKHTVVAPRSVEAAPVRSATPVGGVALSKIWVGAGKKDDATPADLVAVLIKEVGLQRPEIGRIELRDTFALVEVPSEKAELVAKALTGLTVRRRRLTARVDRGMPERGGGGAGRPSGPRGGGRPPRFDR